MKSKPPLKGFTKFRLKRPAFSELITLEVLKASYLLTLGETELWLNSVGTHHLMLHTVLDAVWNHRVCDYDLTEQRVTIPR